MENSRSLDIREMELKRTRFHLPSQNVNHSPNHDTAWPFLPSVGEHSTSLKTMASSSMAHRSINGITPLEISGRTGPRARSPQEQCTWLCPEITHQGCSGRGADGPNLGPTRTRTSGMHVHRRQGCVHTSNTPQKRQRVNSCDVRENALSLSQTPL